MCKPNKLGRGMEKKLGHHGFGKIRAERHADEDIAADKSTDSRNDRHRDVQPRPMSRILAWFSCGDASAVAAKRAIDKYGDRCEVLYCDTFAYEHPDNRRFFADCERWFGREIKVLRSEQYADIFDVFRKTRWLVGVKGARCTTELKKNVRRAYQRPGDLHVFGFTVEEQARVEKLFEENPEVEAEFPLIDLGLTKQQCHAIVRGAGIELPAMYRLGYKNNNCIGCVKGQSGYWNKIRRDFPEHFTRMAKLEREIGAAINKRYENGKRIRVFLDELPPTAGRYEAEPDIDCGVLCNLPAVEPWE